MRNVRTSKGNHMVNYLSKIIRSRPLVFLLMVFMLTCLLISAVLSIQSYGISISLEKKQQELAEKFGVNLDDFPFAFPSEYFSTVLKPGMSISEVHKTLCDYEQVLHCGNGMEVYYYLTTDIKYTDRFFVNYDEKGKFISLLTEDKDSRLVLPNGCVSGLLNE